MFKRLRDGRGKCSVPLENKLENKLRIRRNWAQQKKYSKSGVIKSSVERKIEIFRNDIKEKIQNWTHKSPFFHVKAPNPCLRPCWKWPLYRTMSSSLSWYNLFPLPWGKLFVSRSPMWNPSGVQYSISVRFSVVKMCSTRPRRSLSNQFPTRWWWLPSRLT